MAEHLASVALSTEEATRLDDDIRTAVHELRRSWDDLQALLERAQDGSLHLLLGYKSWTAYVTDVFGEEPLHLPRGTKRTEAVMHMADEMGMSTRAIAAVLGVNHSTINRVLIANDGGTRAQTGLDGKIHPPPALGRRPPPPPIHVKPVPKDVGRHLITVDARSEGEHTEDDQPERLTLKKEAQRLNVVMEALAGELEQLGRDHNFNSRRRFVMHELRPGITRLYEVIQDLAKEK